MSRKLEVGRAVLSSSGTQLQLWLTTLIEILPHSDSTNLQLLKQSDLLEALLSGGCWVRRGHGMHLVLELTVEGEPLEIVQREKLAGSIVKAPVWNQLNLQASLPVGETGHCIWPNDERQMRIDINYCQTEDHLAETQSHRIGINVPVTDVKPPAGVPVLALQSVHFSMDILRTRPRPKSKRQKRERGTASKGTFNVVPKATLQADDSGIGQEDDDSSDCLFPEQSENFKSEHLSGISTGNGKVSHSSDAIAPPPRASTKTPLQHSEKRKQPPTSPHARRMNIGTDSEGLSTEIGKLVDAAMRVSVCSGMLKLAPGIKLVTNTFAGSLSDLCPSLWSLQYISALSQRARFLPTISRSLSRAATSNAKSLSLRTKLQNLIEPTAPESESLDLHARLWLHLQRSLSDKPTRALEAFCSWESRIASCPGSDDLLDDLYMRNEVDDLRDFEPLAYGGSTALGISIAVEESDCDMPQLTPATNSEDYLSRVSKLDMDDEGDDDWLLAEIQTVERPMNTAFVDQGQTGHFDPDLFENDDQMIFSQRECVGETLDHGGTCPSETHSNYEDSEDTLFEDSSDLRRIDIAKKA